MRDMSRLMGLKVFLFGQKDSEALVATLSTGVPTRDTWYRMVHANNKTIGHGYCCTCGTFYADALDGSLFNLEADRWCGCGQRIRIKEWLEKEAKRIYYVDQCLKAGLREDPTAVEIEMARKLGKDIKPHSGKITDEDLKKAYQRMPHRFANPSTIRNAQPRVVDVNDPKRGGSDGSVIWEGSNSTH